MASIYRRTRSYPIPSGAEIVTDRKGQRFAKWTDRKTGRTRKEPLNAAGDAVMVESGNYLIAYHDADGKRQEVNSGRPTWRRPNKSRGSWKTKRPCGKRGIIDPAQERFGKQARRPIAEHVAEFKAVLQAKGNTPDYVETTIQQVEFILARCGAEYIKQLTPSVVQGAIKGIRDAGRSLETCNSYLRAIKGFARWLWTDKRSSDNALATLQGYNADTDKKHPRRELTADELVYLLPFVETHTDGGPQHARPGPGDGLPAGPRYGIPSGRTSQPDAGIVSTWTRTRPR